MDLNTILIILGAIAVVILVIHGIWLNRQNKSKVFDNEDPMKAATDNVDLPGDDSSEDMAPDADTVSENGKDKGKSVSGSVRKADKKEKTSMTDERVDNKADNAELNADLSHITISLRDKPSRDDAEKNNKSVNETTESSVNVRESSVQTKKKEKPKDIEMPAMPKSSDFDETEASSAGALDTLPEVAGENKLPQDSVDDVENGAQAQNDLTDELPPTNVAEESLPVVEEKAVEAPAEEPQPDTSNVIMLYVVAPDNSCFKGSDLHQALDKEGFLFGAQSIFHRHSEFNCHSPVLFSLANLDGPGEFNPENMESMRTFGVAIFMETPVKYGSARTNLRFMINSAKALAKDLNGYLLSDKQEPFTFDVEQEYLSRVF